MRRVLGCVCVFALCLGTLLASPAHAARLEFTAFGPTAVASSSTEHCGLTASASWSVPQRKDVVLVITDTAGTFVASGNVVAGGTGVTSSETSVLVAHGTARTLVGSLHQWDARKSSIGRRLASSAPAHFDAAICNRVIGTTGDGPDANIDPDPLLRVANPAGESSLGDILADAQLWATSGATWPTSNGAPAVLSFVNASTIRAEIGAGDITYGEAFAVQPFAIPLVTMDMTGANIDAVLEQQFASNGPGVLQIPAALSYDRSSTPSSNRVTSILVNGVPLDPAATYRVTLNKPLADGGDGFNVFLTGTNRFEGETNTDVFTRYIEWLQTVAPGPQNRITVVA